MKKNDLFVLIVVILLFLFTAITSKLMSMPEKEEIYINKAIVDEENNIQIVNSVFISGSYDEITVYNNIPVKWYITVPEGDLTYCNHEMLCEEYGLDVILSEGENIIEFTPNKVGDFKYNCWMDMIRSQIHVIERGSDKT